jgi:AraC-like DNA-binding protein
LIVRESETPEPGSQSVVNRLVQIVFIRAVQAYAATMPQTQGDSLAALMDPAIGPALKLMHEQPEAPWSVASLAKEVNMSRSAFAARFAALAGQPPLRYLLQCRMDRACGLLRDRRLGIKEIAARVGYASVAAFSNAFKRWAGAAPGAYRQAIQEGADPSHQGGSARTS